MPSPGAVVGAGAVGALELRPRIPSVASAVNGPSPGPGAVVTSGVAPPPWAVMCGPSPWEVVGKSRGVGGLSKPHIAIMSAAVGTPGVVPPPWAVVSGPSPGEVVGTSRGVCGLWKPHIVIMSSTVGWAGADARGLEADVSERGGGGPGG